MPATSADPYNGARQMALAAGTTLGPYEIISLIGAGGMGEVYRARDPRLNRDVAIKVLPVVAACNISDRQSALPVYRDRLHYPSRLDPFSVVSRNRARPLLGGSGERGEGSKIK
jgi:hypothetical protein